MSEASNDMPRDSAEGGSVVVSRSGGHAAELQTSELLEDLQRTVDAMRMGVVVLDAKLNAEVINRAFYAIWKVTPRVPV